MPPSERAADAWASQGQVTPLRGDVDIPIPPELRALSIAQVQRAVAAAFGVSMVCLLGERRDAEVVLPRRVAMYLARELTGRSLPALGRAFHRDHTTVLDGVRWARAKEMADADLGKRIAELRERLVA